MISSPYKTFLIHNILFIFIRIVNIFIKLMSIITCSRKIGMGRIDTRQASFLSIKINIIRIRKITLISIMIVLHRITKILEKSDGI